MRKLLVFVFGILILFMSNYVSMAESPEYIPSVLDGMGMYERSTIDIASSKSMSSYAQWKGATTETVINILAELNVEPRWPSLLPEGCSLDQELIIIAAFRRNSDFAEYRVGDILSVDVYNGMREEYWEVDELLFNKPDEISLYFSDEGKDTYFCLRYYLLTPNDISGLTFFSKITKMQDNDTVLYAFGQDDLWRQVYLLDAEAARSIYEGNRSEDNLMIFYRLMSNSLDLDTLEEIASSLIPYKDIQGKLY